MTFWSVQKPRCPLLAQSGHLSWTDRMTCGAREQKMPLLDSKIGRGLFAALALNLVLDGLSLVE